MKKYSLSRLSDAIPRIFLAIFVVLSFIGCSGGKQSPKGSQPGKTTQKKGSGALSNNIFTFTIDNLNRLEQFQTEEIQKDIRQQIIELRKSTAEPSVAHPESTLLAAWPESETMRQIVDHLDQWIRTQTPPEWRRDPLLEELPEPLRNLPIVAGLERMEIGPFDGHFLQEGVYLRDVSISARGKSIDDRLRASRLFDWTVRNIQLDIDTPDHIPQFPWETLFFGQGTALERAWVFVLLARQERLEAAILAIDKKSEESPRPWCVAVLIEGKVYLFDPAYGLPIPGPGGLKKGEFGQLDLVPATLDQLLSDESLLSRMNADVDSLYPVVSADLKNVVALVEASPSALSRRMKVVESHLQGKQKMVLTASASAQAERWKTTQGIAGAKLWRLPYETIRRRSELKPPEIENKLISYLPFYSMPTELLHGEEAVEKAGETPPDMRDIYKGASADAGNKKKPNSSDSLQDTESQKIRRQIEALTALRTTFTAPLYKGRVLQLKGEVSGEISAIKYYQLSLPSQEELRIIQEKLFAMNVIARLEERKDLSDEEKAKHIRDIVEAIMTGKILKDAKDQQLVDEIREYFAPFVGEQTELILRGKMNAGYWLGLVTYERGSIPSAYYYFGERTLNAWPGGPWTAGANYNLARTLEAGGEIEQAVKTYRSNTDALDAAGQLLRAKWLHEVNEKKAEEPPLSDKSSN